MDTQNQSTTVKAQAIKENKEMSTEQISIHLEKIQESKVKLELLATKADAIEKKLNNEL